MNTLFAFARRLCRKSVELARLLGLVTCLPLSAASDDVSIEDSRNEKVRTQQNDAVQDILFLTLQKPLLFRVHLYVRGEGFRGIRLRWADAQFEAFDVNHSGALEGEELKRFAVVASSPSTASPASVVRFDPANGKLSGEECRRILIAQLGNPFTIQSTANTENQIFTSDGIQIGPVNLFPKLDLDFDGKLSKTELESAAAKLRRYDQNDDDLLTNQELQQSPPEEQAMTSQRLAGALGQLIVVNPNDSASVVPRRLLESYDKSSRDPVSRTFRRDEKLSPSELKVSPETFQQADRNTDGKLDRAELSLLAEAMIPTVELEVQAPGIDGTFSVKSIGATTSSTEKELGVRINEENRIVLQLGDIPLTLSTVGSPADAPQKLRALYSQNFKSLDNDNNDYLTLSEMRRFGFPPEFFTLGDVDSDEKMFEKEYVDQVDREISLSQTGITWEIAGNGSSFFSLVDSSPSDGRLSLREVSEIPAKLTALDSNRDEYVSLGELSVEMSGVFKSGAPKVRGPFALDLQRASTRSGTSNNTTPQDLPAWFIKMDRNHDRDLSPREFLGRRKLFDQFDMNHDGLISPEEAGNAQQNSLNNPSTPPK